MYEQKIPEPNQFLVTLNVFRTFCISFKPLKNDRYATAQDFSKNILVARSVSIDLKSTLDGEKYDKVNSDLPLEVIEK